MLFYDIMTYIIFTIMGIIWIDNAGSVRRRIIFNLIIHILVWLMIWMLWVPKY